MSVSVHKNRRAEANMKKQRRAHEDSRPQAVMGRVLQKWVEKDSADPAILQTWLCGYGLPPLGSAADDEPFLWLLEGAAEYAKGRRPLAGAVRQLLANKTPPPEAARKEAYWYNLLYLAQGLGLKAALRKFARDTVLKGHYLGIPLRRVSLDVAGLDYPDSNEVHNRPFAPTDPAIHDPCFNYLNSLDKKTVTSGNLRGWLGGNLPFGSAAPYADEEPYVRLIGSIPLGGKFYGRKKVLAEAARELLEAFGGPVAPTDIKTADNLLLLCSELRMPQILWKPLNGWLNKDFLPAGLLKSLRRAVIYNQGDNSLKDVWLGMLRGEKQTILPPDAEDALEAVRMMPLSDEAPAQWDTETIGQALGIVSDWMSDEDFADLLRRIDETYPNLEYGEAIGPCAGRSWPTWAIGRLGLHLIQSPKSANGAEPLEAFDGWLTRYVIPALERRAAISPGSSADRTASLYLEHRRHLKSCSARVRVNFFVFCLIMDDGFSTNRLSAQNAEGVGQDLYLLMVA